MKQRVNCFRSRLLPLLLCCTRWNSWLPNKTLDAADAFVVPLFTTTRHLVVARTVGILATDDDDTASTPPIEIPTYHGPILASYVVAADENAINDGDALLPLPLEGVIELSELGIDIAVGPSMMVPGQLGLYARCIDSVDAVMLPECTLLCGYAKPGTFLETDMGDKTVGFTLQSGTTAIFFERQLMTIQDALIKAATSYGNGACGLAGHDISKNVEDESIILQPVADGFKRFFCPDEDKIDPIPIQNYGQYCNDLAWNQLSPPSSADEYMERSRIHNCVQLVWRVEYDATIQCLVPTWPVSIVSHDMRLENHHFMELGTRYGWNYWQATVNLNDIK